ncbi:hypothetical protein DSO57_1026871 [Entomophthora muscae]|uniref:Uncharacterized protein n=1 Tax=Entomophthora muscae TaxID=34485 RepID=A0ACC2T1Z0_9FUNG|nr:hypothetical protein DSO57_1026871 [Entomophthora muscae]
MVMVNNITQIYQFPKPGIRSSRERLGAKPGCSLGPKQPKQGLKDAALKANVDSLVLDFPAGDQGVGSVAGKSEAPRISRAYVFKLFPSSLHILHSGARLLILSFVHEIVVIQPGFASDTLWVGLNNGEVYFIPAKQLLDSNIDPMTNQPALLRNLPPNKTRRVMVFPT